MIKRIKDWFEHSETILWARVQMLWGVLFGAFLFIWPIVSTTDLSPLLGDPRWIAVWALVNGVVTEYLRRRGTEVRDGVIRSVDTIDKPGAV